MTNEEIAKRFDHHVPDIERVKRHEALRMAARHLVHAVLADTPDGREQALAITKIEEALFWANAAVAREGK